MQFLLISWNFMNPGENAYDVLILTQQFQLFSILRQICMLHAMLARIIVDKLLREADFKILQQWVVSHWLLYFTLSIPIAIVL